MPSAGFHASLHELAIHGRVGWLFASMSPCVAGQARRGNIARVILAAITSGFQMLCGTLEACGLAQGEAVSFSECHHVCQPHGLLAVAALALLKFKCVRAMHPKTGHAEEPSLGVEEGVFDPRRAYGLRTGTQRYSSWAEHRRLKPTGRRFIGPKGGQRNF